MARIRGLLKKLSWILSEDSFKRLKVNPCSRNWLDTCSLPSAERQERFWPIHPVSIYEKREPNSITSPPQKAFEWFKKWRTNPTFVIKLPNGRFLKKDATVITHDGWILADISQRFPFNVPFDQDRIGREILFPKRTHFKGTGLLLSTMFSSGNYYHWMCDLMPRLRLFDLTGEPREKMDHFFVNSTACPFQKETLRLAGVPEDKIVETDKLDYLSCDELYVPSLPNRVGFPRRWMADYLDTLVPRQDTKAPVERVFLDRRDASTRKFVNNEEYCAFMEKLGFTLAVLTPLSVAEQARLFRGAKAMVAVHGTGLINLAFSGPDCRVLEILPPDFENNIFWTLSCEKNVNYSFLRAARAGADGNLVFDPGTMGVAIENWARSLA